MAPCLICYFTVILFYIERKWLLEKFSHYPNFEVQILWKISALQYYCWKYRSTEKLLNFEKFHIIWKIVKHFTRPKQRAALRKLFSLSPTRIPPDKILLCLCKRHFPREIYRNIQTFAFKVLQESSSWASGNGAVQMIFLTPNRNIFAGKFVNWEHFLAVFWEHVISSPKRIEIRKMSEVFWAKLYCKMSDLFRWFLLALRFSATNSGIKKTSDDVHCNVRTKVVCPK